MYSRSFNKNKDLWWNKQLASIGNRYNIGFEADDAAFEAFYKIEMEEGTLVISSMLLH